MKKLTLGLIISLVSVSAFGFIPHKKPTDALLTTDHIYLKDIKSQYWKTSTDCYYNITPSSRVSIKPFDNSIKLNSRVMLSVDGERMVCRVTGLAPASANGVSVSYNQ